MKRKINNGIFYVVISLVVCLGVASFALAYSLNQTINVAGDYVNYEAEQVAPDGELRLGAMPSPDVYQRMNFHAGYQSGSELTATSSTAATYTLAVGDLREDTTYIEWTVNVITTVTTMASSSLAMDALNIPFTGDTREFIIYNATTTAAGTWTLAAGNGVDLQKNEDTADLAINGLDSAKLTFIRKSDTDVMLLMEEYIVAD